jgi:cold shock protein
MIGTVKWFNLQKRYGFIHPDDGSPNIFVHMSAVESAGMSDLKEGQRVIFETQRDERTGNAPAVSLKPLVFVTTPPLAGRFAPRNPFDIISAFISSTTSPWFGTNTFFDAPHGRRAYSEAAQRQRDVILPVG